MAARRGQVVPREYVVVTISRLARPRQRCRRIVGEERWRDAARPKEIRVWSSDGKRESVQETGRSRGCVAVRDAIDSVQHK